LRNENNQITTVASIDYDAFGNIVTGVNPINISYTGKYFDVITNLQWNINRWYDPNTGQWLSKDPIGYDGGDVNLYKYVGNDPVNKIDPLGKQGSKQKKQYPSFDLTVKNSAPGVKFEKTIGKTTVKFITWGRPEVHIHDILPGKDCNIKSKYGFLFEIKYVR
jgi:RHS repeat-associated protein